MTFKMTPNSCDLGICATFNLFDNFRNRRLSAFQCLCKQASSGHSKLADYIGDIAQGTRNGRYIQRLHLPRTLESGQFAIEHICWSVDRHLSSARSEERCVGNEG